MSLIGPRPLLVEYLPLYTSTEARRHEVQPGLTGWAQVNGRNAISWEQKFELDVWYVDHCHLLVDARIAVLTVLHVLWRSGICEAGAATAQPLTLCRPGVVVLGAGGHASVVVATLQAAGIPIAAAYDDDPSKHGQQLLGVDIRGPLSLVEPNQRTRALIALGDSRLRRDVAEYHALDWIRVVHPRATVHESATLGGGTIVCASATIQPNCAIGRHAIVNTSASIDHDCRIGDFAHVGPGAVLAGGVTVGAHTLLGVGSCVAPGVTIGSHSVVGAGAVVIGDLPDHVVAVGCPARVIRRNYVQRVAS
jgi:sugar O-acyltransferase (sialic acid O-acetyltransferase NeuD family)